MKIRNGSFPLLKPYSIWLFSIHLGLTLRPVDRTGMALFLVPFQRDLSSAFDTKLSFISALTVDLSVMREMFQFLCFPIWWPLATHVLSTWNVVSVTEKLNFPFYLILSNLYLNSVATVVDSPVLAFLSLLSKSIQFFVSSFTCLFLLNSLKRILLLACL